VQQRVHIAMPVRLGLQRVRVAGLQRQVRIVVEQAGHLLLLDECDLSV
jgi:ABC-type cobalamin transport system ATPase subunit